MSQRKLFSKKQVSSYAEALFPSPVLPKIIEHNRTGFIMDQPHNPAAMIDISIDPTRKFLWENAGLLIYAGRSAVPMHTEVLTDPVTGEKKPHTLPLHISEVWRSSLPEVGLPFRGAFRKQFIAANKHIPSFEDFLELTTWNAVADASEEAWGILAENRNNGYPAVAQFAGIVVESGDAREIVPHFTLNNFRYRKLSNMAEGSAEYVSYLHMCSIGIDALMIYAGHNPFGTRQLDAPVEFPVVLAPQIEEFLEGLLR